MTSQSQLVQIRQQLLKLSSALDSARQNGLTDETLTQLHQDAKALQRLVRQV